MIFYAVLLILLFLQGNWFAEFMIAITDDPLTYLVTENVVQLKNMS